MCPLDGVLTYKNFIYLKVLKVTRRNNVIRWSTVMHGFIDVMGPVLQWRHNCQ